MDGLPDVAMVAAARAGDQRAMDRLVGEYLPLVYNIVGRALPDRAEVDDVVQETMLRVLRGIGGLRDPERFRSWLVAVTMSQVRQHRRSRGTAADVSALDETIELADPGADFVDLTITQLGLTGQRREVAEATRWLEADDRHLLSLWWLEAAGELTRADLVSALELDPHHVTVRVQRMKAQLDTARMVVRALTVSPCCPELADMAAPWHGRPDSLWRKRFARHVRECRYCAAASSDLVPVERLLAGIGLLPAPAYAAARLFATAHGTGGASASGSGGAGTRSARRIRGRHGGARGTGRLVGKLAAKPMLSALSIAVVTGAGVAAAYSITLRPSTSGVSTLSLVPPQTATTSAATATTAPPAPSTPPATTPSPSRTTTTVATTTTSRPAPPPTTVPPTTTTPPAQTTSAPVTTTTAAAGGGGGSSAAVEQVLSLINQARAKAGLPAYTLSGGLDESATAHNDRMAAGCGLSHQCPGEASLGARETAAGVTWTTCGENIGEEGPVTDSDSAIANAAVALTQSMLDEQPPNDGHRQNILSSSFAHIGIAVTRDSSGTVWLTQDFSN